MANNEGFLERIVHRVERRVEEWREEDRQRRIEVEANRRHLWEEAAERERLLAELVRREEERELSPGDVAREKRVAFVLHSEEAGKALKEFASGQGRLTGVIPGRDMGSGLKGSWLFFEDDV